MVGPLAPLRCIVLHLIRLLIHLNSDFGLRSLQLLLGKSFRIQERLTTQSGEESSSSFLCMSTVLYLCTCVQCMVPVYMCPVYDTCVHESSV